MARRLNIERRRKRIRHYTARRRQRSPVRRAFSYWWGTFILCTLTTVLLAAIIVNFTVRCPGREPESRFCLPQAGLCLIRATAEEMTSMMRMGNARRLTSALSDADIGISLAPTLPEPKRSITKLMSPIPIETTTLDTEKTMWSTLPPASNGLAQNDGRTGGNPKFRPDASLTAAEFHPELKAIPPTKVRGRSVFWVELDAKGHPETVLRLSPKGPEDPWLRQLRTALAAGQGNGSAKGTVTANWDTTKDKP